MRINCWRAYVALRALGLHANFVDILLVQTLVMFLLYFAPTPGASGIGEVLSAAVMSSYVPRELTRFTSCLATHSQRTSHSCSGSRLLDLVRRGLRRSTRARSRSLRLADERGSRRSEVPVTGYDAALLRRLLRYIRPYVAHGSRPLLLLGQSALALIGHGSPSMRSTRDPHRDMACSAC